MDGTQILTLTGLQQTTAAQCYWDDQPRGL